VISRTNQVAFTASLMSPDRYTPVPQECPKKAPGFATGATGVAPPQLDSCQGVALASMRLYCIGIARNFERSTGPTIAMAAIVDNPSDPFDC